MPASRQLLLVRHCEACCPEPDCALTARGEAQAERLGGFLAGYPIDALVSSPFRRARDTIAPFAAAAGMPVAIDVRLAERRMSAEPDPEWRSTLRHSFDDPDHRLPGAESARETVARGRAAVDSLLAGAYRLPVAVTHGQLMALLLHAFERRFDFAAWESLSTPDVYLLESRAGRLSYERLWNEAR